jgi:hypothetical protein
VIIVHQKKGKKWVQYIFLNFVGSRNRWWASQTRFNIYFWHNIVHGFLLIGTKWSQTFGVVKKSDNISSKINISINVLTDFFWDKNPHNWDKIYFNFVFFSGCQDEEFSHQKNYTDYHSTTQERKNLDNQITRWMSFW